MTEAGWTRDKPTEPGWYWWRRDQHALPGVAIVCSDLSGYYMNRTGHNSTFDHVDDVIGEWLGPFTPDSYQQGRVAGARECVEKVRARAALWRAHGGAKIGFPYGHLTVEGECDSIADELGKFARQAQEGGVRDGK